MRNLSSNWTQKERVHNIFPGRHSDSETRDVREEAGDREQAAQRAPGAGQRAHAL